MPLRSYKPTSPGRRGMTRSTFEEITTTEPYKPLLEPMQRGSGRNNARRMTVRHRGGGEKTQYRRIDFKRDKFGVPARVSEIEYDPNRSANIALVTYADGEKRYILHPRDLHPAIFGAADFLQEFSLPVPLRPVNEQRLDHHCIKLRRHIG